MLAVWDVKVKLLFSKDNHSLRLQHGKKIEKSYIWQGIICKGGGNIQTEILMLFLKDSEQCS